MPTAHRVAVEKAQLESNAPINSFRQIGNLHQDESTAGLSTILTETSCGRSGRSRKPSRKFAENADTEALLRADRSVNQPSRTRLPSSR